MNEQYGGAAGPPEPERPGPYQGPGIFGPGSAQGPGDPSGPGTGPGQGPGSGSGPGTGGYGPGGYGTGGYGTGGYGTGGAPGAGPSWPPVYGGQPSTPPRQVTVASTILFILGGLCVLLGLLTTTPAGAEVAETMAGTADAQGLLAVVILMSAVAYLLPAIFLRKRRPWARIMLIVVAAFGVVGGLLSLPASIIGLALHVGLLVMMFQQPTKDWFRGARR